MLSRACLSVTNVSPHGISGRAALTLGLREQVHVGFDDTNFITAEVRWTNGQQVGLMVEDPLLWVTGNDSLLERLSDSHHPRESRVVVNISATLVTSAPVMVGTIRNMSEEGMMIESSGLREGTRLLVKSRGRSTRMGRVQWATDHMAGVFFEGGV
ncbi:PilZ domain-containing protein [Sphingobium chungbukense]|uniref:PilZ domain-containing protein n=1 Tax=Sphingobium chungbukense TaxID=56193 RepID=UPI001E28771E|nr:PilZ domain-containing protein [Sphingobium chungbukense]